MEKETKKKKTTSSSKKATTKPKTASGKATSAKKTVKEEKTNNVKKVASTTTKKEIKKVDKEEVKETKKDVKVASVIKEEKNNDPKMLLNSELGTLIKIVLAIVGVILIFLFITNIIKNNKQTDEDLTTSAEIQYDEILVSNILEQKNSSYYVFVYDEEDLYYQSYITYVYMYENKENSVRVYYADLNSGFNKAYLVGEKEESNIVGANLEALKFEGSALVKVENGKIVKAYEEPNAIIEHLKSLVK